MSGERDLNQLLRGLDPVLDPETYVFITQGGTSLPEGVTPLMTFQEREGLTAIIPQSQAHRLGLAYLFESRRITLQIHSSLEAVGMIAAVATALSRHGIATNPVAAYFHDHLFVKAEQADVAISILRELSVA